MGLEFVVLQIMTIKALSNYQLPTNMIASSTAGSPNDQKLVRSIEKYIDYVNDNGVELASNTDIIFQYDNVQITKIKRIGCSVTKGYFVRVVTCVGVYHFLRDDDVNCLQADPMHMRSF